MNKKRHTAGKTAKTVKKRIAADRITDKRTPNAQRRYKDTVFRMLFNEKENLLSLYNAVNRSSYTEADDLEITTLENAVYTNYKNDVSFIFGFELMIYEHQSTVNPNMPLRDLIYVTNILQGLITEENLYGSELIRLPSPKFIVFYNGTDFQPTRQILRLSEAFGQKQEQPELELSVTVYNINWGYNQELMDACRLLAEYAQYVNQVRQFAEEMPFAEAVENAVDYCIRHDILADFLTRNRAEAIAVSIFEYDEEKHLNREREAAYRKGKHDGRESGLKEGEMRLLELMRILTNAGRNEDISRMMADAEYRERLYWENRL
ncbi:MAG: hypothetical protein NC341_08255 [Blautia sp.]|nr:hypothetical protein [Blautia sp.]MCM1201384.1 hypothetical protein [Bacteroides fragilis]